MVDAGPGTGKTAVACARVAHLINTGACKANRVWLISFTRTAVKEIRNRIADHLEDPDALHNVSIATVDSHAWRIHQGFRANASLSGTYESNIESVLELVTTDAEVRDYIEDTDHLIVDESQDLVGVRANLVVAIIDALRRDAGVTVFADEAQAIYGFADDREEDSGGGSRASGPPLTARIEALGGFSRLALEVVHRTQSSTLKDIFTTVRAMVIAPGADPATRLNNVRAAIVSKADLNTDKIFDPDGTPSESSVFVLFRRRSEVLQASSFLCQKQIPHRLRMSGLPFIIPAWIAATLGEFTGHLISQADFLTRISSAVGGRATDHEAMWAHLETAARGLRSGTVDLRVLRSLLARSQPAGEFVSPDYGSEGPVIGTIHAAKGREADEVWVMLPRSEPEDADLNEETRVIFVGATRARGKLALGRGYKRIGGTNLPGSGRVYVVDFRAGRGRVEIGRASDVRPSGLASKWLYRTVDDVRATQQRLAKATGSALKLKAQSDKSCKYIYRLLGEEDGSAYGALSEAVNDDLFKIADAIRQRHRGGLRKPPDYMPHLFLTGARTIALAADDPEIEQLHEPWRSSGLLLAPMVHGFVSTYFPFRAS